MSVNPYETDLDRNAANFAALTPLSFLERAANVYPERVAIVYGPMQQTWGATHDRCRRLASAKLIGHKKMVWPVVPAEWLITGRPQRRSLCGLAHFASSLSVRSSLPHLS